MIVRIVKMTFKPNETAKFLQLFEERKKTIRDFDGCRHLELWQEAGNEQVFFTYSIWDSEQHLNKYRFSSFFKDTWSKTKVLFADRPAAWSVIQKTVVDNDQ